MIDFKKTKTQQAAIEVISLHDYTMLFGGSRSGKTAIIIYSLIVRACKCKSRHAIIRKTFSAVKRSIFLDTFPKIKALAFPELKVKYNKSDYYITLPNGSEIWFFGLDDSRAERILGMEFSTIFFEEASELDYSPVQLAITRLAEKNELRKRVFFAENPPNKSHWSYWLFIRKLDPIDEVPLEEPERYGCIRMNPEGNLENLDPEYLKLLERMPEKDKKRFLLGEFTDVDDGQVYYAFDRDKHVSEDIKKEAGTIFIAMDFNVDPMTAVIFQVFDNKIFVFDEIYQNNSDTFKMCAELKKRNYYGKVIPDSTGSNRKTSGKSDFQILKDAGHDIMKVRNPFVGDRVNNMNRLLTDERIIISKRCKKLINDLEKVAWKDNQLDQKGANKHLTHISDALGYGCWKLFPLQQDRKSKQRII